MNKWVFIILLLGIFGKPSIAQREVNTLSGQKIMILNDGTWERIIPNEQIVDSTGLLINDLDPMILPSDSSMTDTKVRTIEMIIEAAEMKEIESFLALDQLDKDATINQIALQQSKLNKDKIKEKSLKNEMKLLKGRISDASKTYQTTAKNIAAIKNIHRLKSKDQMSKIKEYATLYNISFDNPASTIQNASETSVVKTKKEPNIAHNANCNIAKDEKINKQRIIATESVFIFSFTPEKLKSYFKDKELMEVHANIEKVGKEHSLVLTARIISKDAAKNYGMVQKGNMLKVSFISGKSVVLTAKDDVRSTIETYTGHSIYKIYYPIGNEDINLFSKVPVDTMGIMWSSGFENYEIFQVDALINHLSCIKSIQ